MSVSTVVYQVMHWCPLCIENQFSAALNEWWLISSQCRLILNDIIRSKRVNVIRYCNWLILRIWFNAAILGSILPPFHLMSGNTSQNTENNNPDVSTIYGCLHQWIIDTYRHVCINTVGQSDDDVVMWDTRVQEVRKMHKKQKGSEKEEKGGGEYLIQQR